MNIFSTITLLAVLLLSSRTTDGQDVGSEICNCSPSSYEFQLDFSLVCPPVNITIGNAIEATSCLVSPFGNLNANNDLVPVAVENIDILELGQNLRVLSQTKIDDRLVDGDIFTYQSAFATPEDVTSVEEVVRAVQVNMVGINSAGDRVIGVFIVTFTNGCGSYPVFEKGQSAGWTKFIDFGQASPELCAAASVSTTPSPTKSPVMTPTNSPTAKITPSPTKSPVMTPTNSPTAKITPSPTNATPAPVSKITPSPTNATPAPVSTVVTFDPTDSPTREQTQTDDPTAPPFVETKAPTETPTDAPTKAPTKFPSESPTKPRTKAPTTAPNAETNSPSTKVTISDSEVAANPTNDSSVVTESPNDLPVLLPEDIDFIGFMSMSMSTSMSMEMNHIFAEHLHNRELRMWKALRGVTAERSQQAFQD
eukprot:jgi/Psemu1/290938/fgenesh1_pg.588_\